MSDKFEQFYEHFKNTTQILDLVEEQYGEELNAIRCLTYYLFVYFRGDKLPARIGVVLGDELQMVQKIEARPDFDHWLTYKEIRDHEDSIEGMGFPSYARVTKRVK